MRDIELPLTPELAQAMLSSYPLLGSGHLHRIVFGGD